MSQKSYLKKLDWPQFEPHPLLPTGFVQTVASTFWPHRPDHVLNRLHDIDLEDGDRIRVVENTPPGWREGQRIVLAVHGLAGAHTSKYMIRIANRLYDKGHAVFRINLRGCGIGGGLAKNPYHSGRSEDSRAVLKWLAEKFPNSPVTQVGYSLGANITLKMVGEDGDSPAGNLDQFVAVSPPANLAKSAEHMQAIRNVFFDQFFVWQLKKDIHKIHLDFPELTKPKWPRRMNLSDLDEMYTAPRSGFASAQDYYAKASSAPLVKKIAVPGLILCSYDDPVIDARSVGELKVPPHVLLAMTEKGGHVGFISKSKFLGDNFWMDGLIERFIEA